MLNFLKIIGTAIFYPDSDYPKMYGANNGYRHSVVSAVRARARAPKLRLPVNSSGTLTVSMRGLNYSGWPARDAATSLQPVHSIIKGIVPPLLNSTALLMDSLSQWSRGEIVEADVIRAFLRMKSYLNWTVQVFYVYGVDISDLKAVSDEVWTAITEMQGTSENKKAFLPGVRKMIKRLLVGLVAKRAEFKSV